MGEALKYYYSELRVLRLISALNIYSIHALYIYIYVSEYYKVSSTLSVPKFKFKQ